jgi:hypothetical protein
MLAYLGLAIVQTWPLVRHLDTHLPGLGLGDNVSFVWNLWWMREALTSATTTFFSTPLLFAPLGTGLVLHTHTAALAWIAATLLSPMSVVTAHNVLLIASLALNGWSVWFLTRAITADPLASFVAGAMFLLSPVIAGRLMGHFNLVAVWPVVLACLAWRTWWQRPRWLAGLALGAAAGLLPFFDYYLTVYFVAFVIVWVVASITALEIRRMPRASPTLSRVAGAVAIAAFGIAGAIGLSEQSSFSLAGVRISIRSSTNVLTAAWLAVLMAWLCRWRWQPTIHLIPSVSGPRAWRSAAMPVIVAASMVLPLAGPAWRLWQSGNYVTQQSALRSGPSGVDVATLAIGPPFHGLLGSWLRGLYRRLNIDPMESAAYLGWTGLILVGGAWRRRPPETRPWRVLLTVFAIWALGPYLVVLGHNTGLLLPGALLRLVPVVNNARIPGRALIMVALCLSVLSARAIRDMRVYRRAVLCVVLFLAVVAESLAAPLPLTPLQPLGVYERVAADASDAAVLPVPFGIRDGFGERGRVETDAVFQQTRHRHPIAGGFIARLSPAIAAWYQSREPYATLLRASAGDNVVPAISCEVARAGLESAGIGFVVLYVDASEPLRRLVAALPLERVDDDGQRVLFRVANCTRP